MLHRGWICGHCVTPWYTVWHTVTMRNIIGDINHATIEGMNKITYTKRCEFCGAEFTTPNYSRRYCSKRCVQATYKMRLKEKRKSEAVKTLERSHGLMPEVCYFNVTQLLKKMKNNAWKSRPWNLYSRIDWFWSGCAAAMKKGLEIKQFTGLTHCQRETRELCRWISRSVQPKPCCTTRQW